MLSLLSCGTLEILGYLPYASNATLLAKVADTDVEALAVYKPQRGERPLWDFPRGTLYRRELCAWIVDRALGWGLVPPTVVREGPAGVGAVQFFLDVDDEVDVRRLPSTHPDALRRLVAFDVIVNNADRKAGHLLVDAAGKLWSVDHGICFHAEPKLRTVVWVYEDEPVPEDIVSDVLRLHGEVSERTPVRDALQALLAPDEIGALEQRARRFAESGRFPSPGPGRNVPWPPW